MKRSAPTWSTGAIAALMLTACTASASGSGPTALPTASPSTVSQVAGGDGPTPLPVAGYAYEDAGAATAAPWLGPFLASGNLAHPGLFTGWSVHHVTLPGGGRADLVLAQVGAAHVRDHRLRTLVLRAAVRGLSGPSTPAAHLVVSTEPVTCAPDTATADTPLRCGWIHDGELTFVVGSDGTAVRAFVIGYLGAAHPTRRP